MMGRFRNGMWLSGMAAGLLSACLTTHVVQGWSMVPTIEPGSHVIGLRVAWMPARLAIHRGDLVVAREPGTAQLMVKRVLALAGDAVSLEGEAVYVGGQRVIEDYVSPANQKREWLQTTLKPHQVFLVGDNRAGSTDSRVFGPVPEKEIQERVVWILRPRHK